MQKQVSFKIPPPVEKNYNAPHRQEGRCPLHKISFALPPYHNQWLPKSKIRITIEHVIEVQNN